MDDLSAWSIQAASEALGYEQFADVSKNRMGEVLDLAESMED
ncbi:hypothetical protein [Liquorilactobacillus satsumensis]|nr:hypothetical protein [Liquorilactobacillus satsumensis]